MKYAFRIKQLPRREIRCVVVRMGSVIFDVVFTGDWREEKKSEPAALTK
jgi:hypothetical protein